MKMTRDSGWRVRMVAVLVALVALSAASQLPAAQATHGGDWAATGELSTARYGHTATLLGTGKVLVAGGIVSSDAFGVQSTSSAEIYDPEAKTWSATGSLNVARSEHTATLLPNGKVLVAGGYGENSSELYDPTAIDPTTGRLGTWIPTGPMAVGRNLHTATLLPDGRVLVAGGDLFFTPVASAEIYDPSIGLWSATDSLVTRRVNHTATLLPSGKVLVVGGESERDIRYSATYDLSSVEVFDPTAVDADTGLAGVWRAGASLNTARSDHSATLLRDGTLLVAGGDSALTSAERYDWTSDTWTLTGNLSAERRQHAAAMLPSGAVLVAGGGDPRNSVERFDPTTGTWSATSSMLGDHYRHTATSLSDGSVLVSSGMVTSAELFTEHLAIRCPGRSNPNRRCPPGS